MHRGRVKTGWNSGRTGAKAFWSALILAVLSTAWPAPAMEAPQETTPLLIVLELREEAYVRGPEVRLGDVARVREGDIPRIEELELTSAPRPGSSSRVDAGLVASRLRQVGFEPGEFHVEGARYARVTTLHLDVDRRVLAEDLRTFILAEMPWDPAHTTVDVDEPHQDYTVPEGQVEIAWQANPQYRYIGRGVFRGEIRVDGETVHTVTFRANVEHYAPVVIATGDISRGSLVSEGDLDVERYPRSSLRSGVFEDPGELVGKVARTSIHAGQVIGSRQVEARQVVRRNQLVTVETRVGALVVRSQARAQEHGRAGDAIILVNPDSREEFIGRVQADGAIVVE